MKRTVAVIIVVVWIVNCGIRLGGRGSEPSGKPVFINEDVGDHIDNIERQKYMLFPNIDGFIEAVVYEHPPGWMWEIVTEKERLVALNEDTEAVLMLTDYIERHDEIVASKVDFESTWNIVDYDILGQPITQKEVDYVTQRLKKRTNRAALAGALAGCCLGASVGFLITFEYHSKLGFAGEDFSMDVSEQAIIIGAALGGLAGFGIGSFQKSRSDGEAIDVIKEERKPRVVE